METERHITLLCVGSGLARRYKQNTLQILALPRGAHIQFRYDEPIIQDGLRKSLRSDELRGARVLLGYVDCTPAGHGSDGYCCVVPCRYGMLVRSKAIADNYALEFELLDFAAATDLNALQRNLPPGRPHWEGTSGNESLVGQWCLRLPPEFQDCTPSRDLEVWKRTVKELSEHQDFSGQVCFFNVLGLFRHVDGDTMRDAMRIVDGACNLSPNHYYELQLYHWDPSADSHSGQGDVFSVNVQVKEPWLEIRTNPILTIDSPYDINVVLMKTRSTTQTEYGLLQVGEKSDHTLVTRLPLELDLPVRLKGSNLKTVLYGLLIGTLLLAQQHVLSPINNQATHQPVILQVIAVALAYVTGLFVAYAIPKPPF
jgi:hypothetical protein